ncbi:MAG: autotransporter-associated beta strand repeat-containing protein [Verrucomicrobiota bacterium]
MRNPPPSPCGRLASIPAALALFASSSGAAPLTWDNSSADSLWSTAPNWDTGSRPVSTDDAIFPAGLSGVITLNSVDVLGVATFPTAKSIQFNDNYTVTGSSFLGQPSGLEIGVNGGSLVTFNAPITPNGQLVKSGAGTLIVGTLLGTTSGVTINGGVLRANVAGTLGGSGDVTTVNSGGTLEINNFHHPHLITLTDGSTLKGLGSASTDFGANSLVISGSATAVAIGAPGAADVLRTDYMAGGSTSTVMTMTGDGTLRLNSSNAFLASWVIPSGKVQIVDLYQRLGQHSAGSVTLSGGILAVELGASGADYTGGPGNNILVTANSTFLNDRLSAGTGRTATFGTLSMGSQNINVVAGPNVTNGDAGFYFGSLTLTGNPLFSITQGSTGPGHLSLASLTGGGVPRAITKTGPGNLSFSSGGANELATGSTVTVSGGGTLLLNFPAIGPDATTVVTMAQNPIGNANLSMTDGTLMLRGSGAAAIYALATNLTLGGTVVVDADRNASGFGNDVFRMASITLKPSTVMGISGDNTFGIGSLGPMVLEGNATLQGFNSGSIADGVINLYGGISGGPTSALTIANTTRPINLTIDASSTYGGGTVMHGGNVTLNAANGFGTGTTTLNGGTLTLNADAALNGTVTVNGGTLIAVGQNILATNPVVLNGGVLDLRTTASVTLPIPSLTVSGTSALNFSRFGSTSSFLITTPTIDVLGATTLTTTNAASATNLIPLFDLAGDLTLSASSTTRVTSITEDGSPRKLIKTGTGQLNLEGVSSHSGGTEVLAGVLYVAHSNALGSGPLTIGATSGTAAATARFAENLTIPNNIVVRSGSSGAMTLDAETGRVTWNGNIDLQKSLVLDNGSATAVDLSYVNGVISGPSDLSKISAGEIVLAYPANTFGSGTPTSVTINGGTLTVASNGALGNPSNGVNLLSGVLKVSSTFSTPRTLTVTGTGTSVNVTIGNTFTMTTPVTGTGTFTKGDAGILAIAPAVDAAARGSAITLANGGILRVQGLKNLGNASPISVDNGGIFEFAMDPDTNFAHPLSIAGSGGINVDRAVGGSGTNGRHTLGAINVTSSSTSSLTVSGANGYGLSAPSYTTGVISSLDNNAPGTLILGSLTGNPGTSNTRVLYIGGSSDIEITGATSVGAGSGTFGLVKTGAGKFTFGSSLAGFGRVLTVNDGTFDLNGNAYTSTQVLTMGGVASVPGAKIQTGAAGSLNFGAGLTFSNSGTPAGALITGNVGIGALPQPFNIGNTTAAVDMTINGPITGSAGSSITKSGTGTLLLSGAGNTLPGLVSVTTGVLELGKPSGDAIGTGGLATSSTGIVRLAAAEQINNSANISIGAADESFLELANFTETVGPLTITQSDAGDYSGVKTGPTGILVLNGNLSLNNNSNSSAADGREVLITGSGSEFTPTTDGFLDLGGVPRTIHVTTTTVGTNEPRANATIETQIINGGIVKTGPRTLFLTNPTNNFAGGLQIAGGTVRSGGGTSLGVGPITFLNTAGVAAGIDFGTLTGTSSENFDLTGTGDATFTYSALAPNTLILAGDFNTAQNLIFDVVNGSIADGDTATLDLTGTIDDAANATGLTKVGNGTLKLAPANTYSGGTTIQKGILAITADSALGNTTIPLTIDGGCLQTSLNPVLARNLVFTANGGSVRSLSTFEIPGEVDWGTGTSAFFGSGRTLLTGTTTATAGNLQLGTPTTFATTSTAFISLGHTLSLRGPAALPTGNLSISKNAVLELGNGDFTRPLGTGPGQVQLPTENGGGWAAYGANRIVNLGGAGANLVWGQVSPPFLYRNGPGSADIGQLILGSFTATHTVDFQNTLEIPTTATFTIARDIVCSNGAAAVDGRISGDVIQNNPVKIGYLGATGDGTLEISGDLLGRFRFLENGQGTTILSGNNTGLTDGITVFMGSLVIATDSSLGTPESIQIFDGSLDATAMTIPVSTTALGQIYVDGTLTGNVAVNGHLEGNGEISGNVTVPASSDIYPGFDATLHIGGNLTMSSDSLLNFEITGTQPEVDHNRLRVTGAVNLSGILGFDETSGLALNDSLVLLLNDGTDPINGTFAGLPESGAIPIGNSLALQFTYLANGDGGAVGNDFGVTVIIDNFSSDLALTAAAPVAVDLGAAIAVTYTIYSPGPGLVTDGVLNITLPLNATLVNSSPGGTVNLGVLSVPLPSLAAPDTTTVTLHLTAPAVSAAVEVQATVTTTTADASLTNNSLATVTAVLPGGSPVLASFSRDPLTGDLEFVFNTIAGVSYIFESSIDLGQTPWEELEYIDGDGQPYLIEWPVTKAKDFFRIRIIP